MKKLTDFLYTYRNFLIFIGLELFSIRLIIKHNAYQGVFLASANSAIGSIYYFIDELNNYFLLKKKNQQLYNENRLLKEMLKKNKHLASNFIHQPYEATLLSQYDFIVADIINNSINKTKNYLTINKGAIHGIAPGMGVISNKGIVGKVKAVSKTLATVTSFLHTDVLVSSRIVNSNIIGTATWPGTNPSQAQLLYVPRHVSIHVGDTLTTSGYNGIFPEGILVGYIKHIALKDNAIFYVKNYLKKEKDDLTAYNMRV